MHVVAGEERLPERHRDRASEKLPLTSTSAAVIWSWLLTTPSTHPLASTVAMETAILSGPASSLRQPTAELLVFTRARQVSA